MDSLRQEEQLVGVKQEIDNLQKQINDLKGKSYSPFSTALTVNPFSTLGERKVEQGSTGSSRYRKLLIPNDTTATSLTTRGSFTGIPHIIFADGSAGAKAYGTVPVPSDAILGGFPTINILWMSTEATTTVDWQIVVVYEVEVNNSVPKVLLAESSFTSVAAPAAANSPVIRSVNLTLPPSPDHFIYVLIQRDGTNDTNNGTVSVMCMWIDYLAHS